MLCQKRLRTFFSVFTAIIVLVATNHCVFEDFFTNISQSIFGIEKPEHLLNHVGANSNHTHKDSQESHAHGEPHQLTAVHSEKNALELVSLSVILVPLVVTVYLNFKRFPLSTFAKRIIARCYDPQVFLKKLISSLTLAPQAPPFRT